MPSREIELFLIDILISIEKVKRYTKGIEGPFEFLENDIVYAATLRELIVIGEALKHVLADPVCSFHVHDKWRSIVNFRNILAHEYFDVRLDDLYNVISKQIFEFEEEFLMFVRTQSNDVFYEAFDDVKEELKHNKWLDSLSYLQSVEKGFHESY